MQASTHPEIAKLLTRKPRVCIVGGGWSGLYALKWFVEEGLDDIVLFEQTNSVGGVWVYTEDKPGTCYFPLIQPLRRAPLAAFFFLHCHSCAACAVMRVRRVRRVRLDAGGCFKNTRTTASKSYLHASDFPMADELGHFPTHTEVLDFLKVPLFIYYLLISNYLKITM
jgi:cation diffusion facilitator CzcD-associated flavoprotein CzcO